MIRRLLTKFIISLWVRKHRLTSCSCPTKSLLSELKIYYLLEPKYQEFRKGDVRHSLADIKKAKTLLGYSPFYNIDLGLRKCIGWYIDNLKD